jgi:hypothetical protein
MNYKFYLIMLIAVFFISDILTAQYQISNSIICSGGNATTSANNNLSGSIGESVIGNNTNANYKQQTGFWYVYQQSDITSVEDEELLPTVFKLEQNYPNPFNPSTKIKFAVPEKSNVLIKIYDILGSEVETLVNKEMDAGWYDKDFNAAGLSSGIYLFRMEAGNYVNTKKMIYLK